MNIENIISKDHDFQNIKIDRVLFEDRYPILFICLQHNIPYIFICYNVSKDHIDWIASKTTFSNIIELLSDKITIRDAFLAESDTKIMLSYNGQSVNKKIVNKTDLPDEILPTPNEYMNADEGEFDEEINHFSMLEKTGKTIIYYFEMPTQKMYGMQREYTIQIVISNEKPEPSDSIQIIEKQIYNQSYRNILPKNQVRAAVKKEDDHVFY